MADPHQTDHEGEALGELLSQFQDQPNISGLVVGLMGEVQHLEDSCWDLRVDRLLAAAVGAQLDRFGDLVGEVRGSLTDADYRKFIAARILANLSGGNPDRLIQILRIIAAPFTAGTVVEYRQVGYGPEFSLTFTRDAHLTADIAARVAAEMDDVYPAGVGSKLVEGLGTGDGVFRFDSGPGWDKGKLAGLL